MEPKVVGLLVLNSPAILFPCGEAVFEPKVGSAVGARVMDVAAILSPFAGAPLLFGDWATAGGASCCETTGLEPLSEALVAAVGVSVTPSLPEPLFGVLPEPSLPDPLLF